MGGSSEMVLMRAHTGTYMVAPSEIGVNTSRPLGGLRVQRDEI